MNKMILFAFVVALLAIQACSKKSHRETSEFVEEGPFSNDPDTKIRSKDKKFLCDFQWTDGYKDWDYGSDEDKYIGKLGSAKGSWCLIPYGESTEYKITIQDSVEGGGKARHYFCRVANSIYTISNESEVTIVNDSYYKEMKCAELNSDSIIAITAGTSNFSYKDERLYHIISQADNGDYSITGHLDLLLVKPVYLSVLWEPILNEDLLKNNVNAEKVNKIKEDWKMYMKKVGYYIDIKNLPIVFPNNKSYMPNEKKMTLMEDGKVLKFPDAIDWYNESINKHPTLSDIFGTDNLSANETFDYVFTVIPNYNIKYNVVRYSYTKPKENEMYGTCKIVNKGTSNDVSGIIKGSLNNTEDKGYYYSMVEPIEGSFKSTEFKIFLDMEIICTGVTMFIGEVSGGSPKYFNTKTGYVVTHENFFKKDNPGRLMAAIMYSKILGINPMDGKDELYLSSYEDKLYVEQPKKYWEIREEDSNGNQQMLQEFASIMQYFNSKSSAFPFIGELND